MKDYSWAIVGPAVARDGGVCSVVLDFFDHVKQYRIVTKLLLRDQILVRAAFHDYVVDEIADSIAYFAPMLESLRLNDEAPASSR
jgi:hypothetical protein